MEEIYENIWLKEQIHSLPPTRARMEFELQMALSQSLQGVGGSDFKTEKVSTPSRTGPIFSNIEELLKTLCGTLYNVIVSLSRD